MKIAKIFCILVISISTLSSFQKKNVGRACARIKQLTTFGYRVRLLRPLAEDGISLYKGGTDRGEDFNVLVTTSYLEDSKPNEQHSDCNSRSSCGDRHQPHKEVNGWQWDGFHEWEEERFSPAWKPEEILLI